MKTILTTLLATVCASLVIGEEFTLSDPETGQQYGPFAYSNDAPVRLDDRTFILTRTHTTATDIEERMRRIIIPSIEFRQANIIDILTFLAEASIGGIEQPSVNIVPLGLLAVPAASPVTNLAPIDMFAVEQPEEPRQATTVPPVTLNLRRVSLYDALSIVCEVAGLRFRIDDRGVVFVTSEGKEIRPEEMKDQPVR